MKRIKNSNYLQKKNKCSNVFCAQTNDVKLFLDYVLYSCNYFTFFFHITIRSKKKLLLSYAWH